MSQIGDEVEAELLVGMIDPVLAKLITRDHRTIEFPTLLLPENVVAGSIVKLHCTRAVKAELEDQEKFHQVQHRILEQFAQNLPNAPVLRVRNTTQTSVVLEWDPIDVASADLHNMTLYKGAQRLGPIPTPERRVVTKISNLETNQPYDFRLVLATSAGDFESNEVHVQTHALNNLSGLVVCVGALPGSPLDRADIDEVLGRLGSNPSQESVRLDTTHFVCTVESGDAYARAVEFNIPILRPEWLQACEAAHELVSVRGYYLSNGVPQGMPKPKSASRQASVRSVPASQPQQQEPQPHQPESRPETQPESQPESQPKSQPESQQSKAVPEEPKENEFDESKPDAESKLEPEQTDSVQLKEKDDVLDSEDSAQQWSREPSQDPYQPSSVDVSQERLRQSETSTNVLHSEPTSPRSGAPNPDVSQPRYDESNQFGESNYNESNYNYDRNSYSEADFRDGSDDEDMKEGDLSAAIQDVGGDVPREGYEAYTDNDRDVEEDDDVDTRVGVDTSAAALEKDLKDKLRIDPDAHLNPSEEHGVVVQEANNLEPHSADVENTEDLFPEDEETIQARDEEIRHAAEEEEAAGEAAGEEIDEDVKLMEEVEHRQEIQKRAQEIRNAHAPVTREAEGDEAPSESNDDKPSDNKPSDAETQSKPEEEAQLNENEAAAEPTKSDEAVAAEPAESEEANSAAEPTGSEPTSPKAPGSPSPAKSKKKNKKKGKNKH